jgi:hypothetical protein
VAEFPFPLSIAQQRLHGVQIALFHAAHGGFRRQPARHIGEGESGHGAQQGKRQQSGAKGCHGQASGRFGGAAIIQGAEQAKPARRIGRRDTPAGQNGPALMGENLLKAWDFSRGGDQRRQMPGPRRVLGRRQGSAAPGFADDAPDLGAEPFASRGIQLGKTRHAAFGGEETHSLFGRADQGEKARNLGAQGFTQQRR